MKKPPTTPGGMVGLEPLFFASQSEPSNITIVCFPEVRASWSSWKELGLGDAKAAVTVQAATANASPYTFIDRPHLIRRSCSDRISTLMLQRYDLASVLAICSAPSTARETVVNVGLQAVAVGISPFPPKVRLS